LLRAGTRGDSHHDLYDDRPGFLSIEEQEEVVCESVSRSRSKFASETPNGSGKSKGGCDGNSKRKPPLQEQFGPSRWTNKRA